MVRFFKNSSRFRQILKPKTKRKLVAFSVILTSIILGQLSFVLSGLSAFFVTKFLSGKITGKRGIVPSIKLPLGGYKVHLHHWLICAGVTAYALLKGSFLFPAEWFYGLLSGMAFQGIYFYKDWHSILSFRRSRVPARSADDTDGKDLPSPPPL